MTKTTFTAILVSAARAIFGIEPVRFAWANANRVTDDHELEVEAIAAEASRAVAAKLAGTTSPRVKYTDPDFRRQPKTALFCYQCQKDLDPESPYRLVYVVDGMKSLHPDDVDGYGKGKQDLGWLPIGSDCARRLGLEWSVPKKESQ